MRAKGHVIRAISVEQEHRREAGEAATDPALVVEGLSHRFGELETLRDLSFRAGPGETLAFVGPSGCGKSTLLELIAGLAEPTEGTISVNGGTAAGERLGACAWMPQSDELLPWKRAVDNAALALRFAGVGRGEARERASALLGRLGLGEFERARPRELSGGMRQRVAFARTLLSGRGVLLLDEPFAALDAITRADLQVWLRETLASERRTTLLVTHDVEEALYLGDRVLVLSPRPGRVVWETPAPPSRTGDDRAAEVSAPQFVELRHLAQERLAEAMRS